MSNTNRSITATLTAENTFSDSVEIQRGRFNLSLSGTWVASVTVQRSFDDGVNWVDVESFSANTEQIGQEPEDDTLYRFGIKTGNYTSGSVVGRISQ